MENLYLEISALLLCGYFTGGAELLLSYLSNLRSPVPAGNYFSTTCSSEEEAGGLSSFGLGLGFGLGFSYILGYADYVNLTT